MTLGAKVSLSLAFFCTLLHVSESHIDNAAKKQGRNLHQPNATQQFGSLAQPIRRCKRALHFASVSFSHPSRTSFFKQPVSRESTYPSVQEVVKLIIRQGVFLARVVKRILCRETVSFLKSYSLNSG
jgi:hypothetical protein